MTHRTLPMIAGLALTLGVGSTTLGGLAAPGQDEPTAGALIKVALIGSDDHLVVGLVGDQVLSGTVQEISTPPYRLFVDFAHVLPEVEAVTPVGRVGVERIRVALNQADPPVTRVVLDLSQPSTYRVERDPVAREFRIIIGSAAAVDTPVAIREPAGPVPVTGPASVRAAAYTRWFSEVAPEVERLLTAPSSRGVGAPSDSLDRDGRRHAWRQLQQACDVATPPLYLQTAHDLLSVAIDLGVAGSGGAGAGPTDPDHAAQAGATMFLKRAQALVEALQLPTASIDQP